MIDTTGWRLPSFVDYAVCRNDEDNGFLAARGIVPLRTERPAAIGMQVKLEVHLFAGVDDDGWGIVTGPVTSVTGEHLTATAVLTSDGSPLLDQSWSLLLVRDPATFDGAWFAQRMTAESVVTVPRMWPRMLVNELRVRGHLVCADPDVDLLCSLVRATSTEHLALTTRGELAAFTARSLLRAFEHEDRVKEIRATTEDLMSLLEELFAR